MHAYPSMKLPPLPIYFRERIFLVSGALEVPTSNVFIAGGALRDLVLGRDYRDIDIFVFGGFAESLGKLSLLEDNLENVDDGRDPENERPSKVIKSARAYLPKSKVDVIILKNPQDNIFTALDSFDIGLSKIAHSGQHYIIHDDFIKDVNNQQIRVCAGGAYGPESIRKRIEKFKGYFPTFSVDDSYLLKLEEGGPPEDGWKDWPY